MTGVVAAAAVPWDRPGVGWAVTAVVAALTTVLAVLRPVRVGQRGAWALVAVALMAVGAVRSADWLFVLCLLTAGLAGELAVVGGRSLGAMALAPLLVPIAALRALPWASRATAVGRIRPGASAIRTAAAAAVGLALLLVFGSLLASADAAFASVLDSILPTVDGDDVPRWVVTFALFGLGTLGACYLAISPPTLDSPSAVGSRRSLRRVEWGLPVGGLVGLFAVFVGVQATVLFGGGAHVLRTANLTYAEYARRGFWQLLAVTLLTLMVVAAAARVASRETTADRIWLRALLGPLALLTLVIVASAMSRMWAYEQAYGFTRLRVLVSVCELWLGALFVLVLVAGVGLRARWLPRVAVALAMLALLGIAVGDPDGFIAERNIIRYGEIGRIDVDYLAGLSADAVPALDRLPEPLRSCALVDIRDALVRSGPEEPRQWNLARERARQILADRPIDESVLRTCWKL